MAAFKLPLLAVVVMGMMVRRVPAWAAKTSLVGGVLTYFLLDWLLGRGNFGVSIHWLHLAAVNTMMLCVFMLLTAKLAPAPVPATVVKAPAMPLAGMDLTPWSAIRPASIGVALLAVGLYFSLWLLARSS